MGLIYLFVLKDDGMGQKGETIEGLTFFMKIQ